MTIWLRVLTDVLFGGQAGLPLWDMVLKGFAECGSIQQFKAILRELAMRNLPRTKMSYALELKAHLHNYDATGVVCPPKYFLLLFWLSQLTVVVMFICSLIPTSVICAACSERSA